MMEMEMETKMEFHLEYPLTNFNHHFCHSLFLLESDHMPSHNYAHSLHAGHGSVRRQAIASISQFSSKFGPFLSYLALNYLDRFLSTQGIPQPKTWVVRLVASSCVSLAAKMKKTEFSLNDGVFMFDAQTIQRMEYLILGALEWRMRSITPFSFIPFFISLFKLEDPPLKQALKARAVEIIFKAQIDIKFLEFKPSIVAASALVFASHELFPLQVPCFRKAISSSAYVNKENMLKCYNRMQEMDKERDESMLDMAWSVNSSGVDVLDQHFSSTESETTGKGIDTTASGTLRTDRDKNKRRRRINDYPTLLMID